LWLEVAVVGRIVRWGVDGVIMAPCTHTHAHTHTHRHTRGRCSIATCDVRRHGRSFVVCCDLPPVNRASASLIIYRRQRARSMRRSAVTWPGMVYSRPIDCISSFAYGLSVATSEVKSGQQSYRSRCAKRRLAVPASYDTSVTFTYA